MFDDTYYNFVWQIKHKHSHESQKVGCPNQNYEYCQYVCALPF